MGSGGTCDGKLEEISVKEYPTVGAPMGAQTVIKLRRVTTLDWKVPKDQQIIRDFDWRLDEITYIQRYWDKAGLALCGRYSTSSNEWCILGGQMFPTSYCIQFF